MMKKWFYIFFIFLIACSTDDENTQVLDTQLPDLPDQEMWDFDVTATNKGKLEAIIKAGHMRRFEKLSVSFFDQGVHIDFYNAEGEIASVLTAESGELEESSMNVKATGNVVVVSDSGQTLYTEELFYNKERDRIYSNVKVKFVTDDGGVFYGSGFESNAEMTNYRVTDMHDSVLPETIDLSLDRFSKNDTIQDSSQVAATDSSQLLDSLTVDAE